MVAGSGEVLPRSDDVGGPLACERQGDPVTGNGRAGPVRVERADGVLGVPGNAQAAPELGLDVRRAVRVRRDVQAEPAVEGERRGHVGDDELDDGGSQPHGADRIPTVRQSSGRRSVGR